MRTFETLREQHPCMSGRAGETGRIHLPVSPGCNIHCRYCKRTFTLSEERPGTCQRVLPVEEVPGIVERALALCPQITTVGIAGPGHPGGPRWGQNPLSPFPPHPPWWG